MIKPNCFSQLQYWLSLVQMFSTKVKLNKIKDFIHTEKISHQKTCLQCEQLNGRKSSRLQSAKLQCVPRERRSASFAMMELYSECSDSLS